ncbi:hypothetical protein P152DRAFT_35243 [Eremomyces bilateralis CBS 781.70]|uniref:Uncharacterized protein n=1 Tax=Eremomyces bilateralis CBS 781.70 TaxID=1392243 RepID=A0A6G1G3C5_9PEZI|nr:uncharacterized protein P152DRAFT_35243 [Eremomyces bilateralis CBS 781.70]KAF1812431.1 hypothetical protein P152DRAFT_35243 [Eremomyces bilateralis CBS 781.70]
MARFARKSVVGAGARCGFAATALTGLGISYHKRVHDDVRNTSLTFLCPSRAHSWRKASCQCLGQWSYGCLLHGASQLGCSFNVHRGQRYYWGNSRYCWRPPWYLLRILHNASSDISSHNDTRAMDCSGLLGSRHAEQLRLLSYIHLSLLSGTAAI